jgi:hypothetical protein
MSYTGLPDKLSTISDLGINSWNQTGSTGWVGDTWTGIGEENDYAYVGVNLQVDESGTLFFDFSQDGVNWSSYPVNGFTIVSGINEVHTAWKGGRYMRPRFVGTGGRSYFRLETYYSNLSLPLSAPLNQSIGSDQDAQVVRAVGIGEDPVGTYTNVKTDGLGFQTLDNLASGTTFNSDVINAQGYTQVQTHIVCDNDGTLGFKFCSTSNCSGTTAGQDGVERYLSVPYSSSGGFQLFSAPAFTPYVQYSFTNNGTDTTTQLFYETKLLTKSLSGQLLGMDAFISPTMVANLGRNVIVGRNDAGRFQNVPVDANGVLKTAIESPLTAFGEIQIAEMTPVIQVTYPYNINPLLVNTTVSNGGSVTQSDNMVVLQTSGGTSSSVTLETVNVAKYRAGQGIVARFTGLFTSTATTTDSHQVIGIGDSTDGYFFGYSGSTFGIHHRINSGTTFIAQSTWNVDVMDGSSGAGNPSSTNLDPTKGNVFQIQYQWLGFGAINFFIESDVTGKYVPIHQIKYANNKVVPSSYNPTFPIRVEVDNGTSTDVLTMKSASMAAFVEGKDEITGPLQSATGSNSGGNDGEVLTLRNVSVFPSGSTTTNRVVAYLRDLSISNDGANNTIVRVQIVEDPIFSVSPTYTYIDPDNSIIEVGTAGTYTSGSGKVIATFGVTQVSNVFTDLSSRRIALRPGKTIAFITQGDASTSTVVDVSWSEDF